MTSVVLQVPQQHSIDKIVTAFSNKRNFDQAFPPMSSKVILGPFPPNPFLLTTKTQTTTLSHQQMLVETKSSTPSVQSLLHAISDWIEKQCRRNDPNVVIPSSLHQQPKLNFYSTRPSKISVLDYLHLFRTQSDISESAFVVACVYIERFQHTEYPAPCPVGGRPGQDNEQHGYYYVLPAALNSYNVHRIIATALLLGHKFLDDNTHTNKQWASMSGVGDLAAMNELEMDFLQGMKHHLFVSQHQLQQMKDRLGVEKPSTLSF